MKEFRGHKVTILNRGNVYWEVITRSTNCLVNCLFIANEYCWIEKIAVR